MVQINLEGSQVTEVFFKIAGGPTPTTNVTGGPEDPGASSKYKTLSFEWPTLFYVALEGAASEVTKRVEDLSSSGVADTNFPVFTNGTDGVFTAWKTDVAAPSNPVTYYVPYRIPQTVLPEGLTAVAASITRETLAPASPTSEATGTDSAASCTSATADPTSLANCTEPLTTCQRDLATCKGDSKEVSHATLLGASIGGSVGGCIVGIAGALLILWCLQRRRSRTSAEHASRAGRNGSAILQSPASTSKEMQVFGVPAGVTGWQKHLPQDKDDATISRAVKTIFDHVQIHVEGYYNAKQGKLNSSATAALGRVTHDELLKVLSKGINSTQFLEAILVRWIIHRISLRSDAGDSFLPFEYTKIPEQNGWHMESDDQGSGYAKESIKGFPQAFSQWRMLTAFLHPDPRADQDFKKHLDVKIDQGVRALTDAFAPWDIRGRSIENRNKSLRRILQLANDAGVLLFAQPSTFIFDWSSREGTVTVWPALVKRLDEFAKPLPNASVLVAARRVNL